MDNLSTKLQEQDHLNQESFSFSSFDFNSSFGIFSDDDYEDEHGNEEAYIEITLEQEQKQDQQTITPTHELKENDDHGIELELLRVSFSSSVCSFPGFSCSSTNDSSACSSLIATIQSHKITEAEAADTVLCINPKTNGGKIGFANLSRLVDVLLSTLKVKSSPSASAVLLSNSSGHDLGGSRQHEKKGSWELIWNSKAISKGNGGARKLLNKFRTFNILSMVASFVKPKPRHQAIASQEKNFTLRRQSSSNSQRNIIKHLEGAKSPKLSRRNRESSRFLDINLGSVTKMVEAVSKNIVRSGKNKQSKSCPGSIKSSPIHHERNVLARSDNKVYATDNSVQAAIAHCKQSFGQNR